MTGPCTMAEPIRHVRGHLRRSDPVAALLDEIERRERLLSALREAVPTALARHVRQVALDAGRLTVIVDSPVWVDRLRFLLPQVVDAFTTRGVELLDYRVRVAPGYDTTGADQPQVASGHRSAVAVNCLRQAADALGDRPLAESLRQLARSLGEA